MNIDITSTTKIISCKTKLSIIYALAETELLSTMELSSIVDVLPQTLTHHFKMLLGLNILNVKQYGREKKYYLTNHKILDVIEALEELIPVVPSYNKKEQVRTAFARSCYDHLAGWLGVSIANNLLSKNLLKTNKENFFITNTGELFFSDLGIDLQSLKKEKRYFARCCLDWTQKKHHIGGALGAALMSTFKEQRCFTQNIDDRKLMITTEGNEFFLNHFNIDASKFQILNENNTTSTSIH